MAVKPNKSSIRGIAWPWQQSPGGIPQNVTDEDAVAANLLRLYSTNPGEDKTDPAFGTNLIGLIFETTGDILNSLLTAEVNRVTTKYEPRAQIDSVTTSSYQDDQGNSIVEVLVEYLYRGNKKSVQVPVTVPNQP